MQKVSKDGFVNAQQIKSFSTASVEHPGRLLPDDEPREPREQREQPLRINVRPVHTDLPPPINTEPAKATSSVRHKIQSSWPDVGHAPGCVGCEAAMVEVPSRDHTEQCRTRIIQAMSRSVSDAEPNM